ncbi:hypothetical protein H0I31_02275 [Tenacibaculum sp. AHE15PA]|uniref:hypothetical protein n=1 Tax=unclassified Tenacibaculum TaxID=2635139 RepID=UPI001C4EE984|nr:MULTISPECIES: hypothetical protein [unclassified Tenacibaculum]QXP72549.1 hypothetical protein H0I30_07530 [Tenacibaculum sp. AHE14PA]QXP76464.1 hypothetical protein H0I31_02275 [Tenacibaculum sp. AHE15PA]
MNNKIITLITLLFSITTIFSQKDEFNLIALDSTWGQEVLRFPARHMNYIGVGDIRFPPKGWIKPEHTFFWSYTYAWNINVNRKITEEELTLDLVKYFNSLNKVDMNATADKKYASAKITSIKKTKSTTFFKGYINTFDRFATNKLITLNVLIESNYCKKEKKTVILFKFSPKEFNHKVWKTLNEIKLHTSVLN